MLQKLNEIQAFIKWCTINKVKSIKIKDLEFEISDYAFVEQLQNEQTQPQGTLSTENVLEEREMSADTEQSQAKDDEDLLFWSSN